MCFSRFLRLRKTGFCTDKGATDWSHIKFELSLAGGLHKQQEREKTFLVPIPNKIHMSRMPKLLHKELLVKKVLGTSALQLWYSTAIYFRW